MMSLYLQNIQINMYQLILLMMLSSVHMDLYQYGTYCDQYQLQKPLSILPSTAPSITSSVQQLITSSISPTQPPSIAPSIAASISPSITPTQPPSIAPSNAPSIAPTQPPSIAPPSAPSIAPT
eukprot:42386_1